MSITEKQAIPENLSIQKAYMVRYNQAKKIRSRRIFITYLLALGVPILVINYPYLKDLAGIVGASWSIIALILSYVEKSIVKSAAKIQEDFDLALFAIERNKILIGDPIPKETVHNLNNKLKGELNQLWYGDTNSITYPYDVLICQRTNIVWDWRLRKNYFKTITIILLLLFIGGIIFSLQINLLLADYIKMVFLPSSSAFILGFKELNEHYDNYTAKEKLESKVNEILDNCIAQQNAPALTTLRQIQDVIFILRKCTAIIPNWFAELYKKSYDKRMQVVLNKYKQYF